MTKLPERKPTRLHNYDYSAPGAYFITVCTYNRNSIFSYISKPSVGEGSPLPLKRAPGTSAILPAPRLSRCGKIVDSVINTISEKYKNVSVKRYVIMPNHIHLLLSIVDGGRGDPSPTVSVDRIVGWLKYQATKEINAARQTPGERVFQRSFYDHIVRNRDDYDEILKYIAENPLRWKFDRFYTE